MFVCLLRFFFLMHKTMNVLCCYVLQFSVHEKSTFLFILLEFQNQCGSIHILLYMYFKNIYLICHKFINLLLKQLVTQSLIFYID